ncbi:MAG: sensor domain-containing diguanylate cyclase [Candidatus Omnitrophica bacterium]|jgi:diguanylate cyclase (GGDEF)-like protein|nr:sensor domain-containing diguanylate cyclase [Candidatus Omnitrophota bacterium]
MSNNGAKKKFSIQELSLKRRIWIAISLVTLIPLIVIGYHFSGLYISIHAVVVAFLIVSLGWWIIFEVFTSIARVYSNSKKTLQNIGEDAPDVANEVQSLESIIDILSSKMRSGLEQLKDFSQKTEELNHEVSRKVLVLSTILQANDLFSKEVPSREILQFLNQRLKEIVEMRISFCVLLDEFSGKFELASYCGIDAAKVEEIIDEKKSDLYKAGRTFILDKENKNFPYMKLANGLDVINMAVVPVLSRNQQVGILVVASHLDNFMFSKDDLSALNLFSQNIAIIWEHKRLSHKVDELEVFDYLTGLYNEKYVEKRLDEEMVRSLSYQRPCALLFMEISNYKEYQENFGPIESEKLMKKTAKMFREGLRPIDIPGRFGLNRLCAILIEKNKRQSQVIAKELKKKIEDNFKNQVKLSFSVAENPIDGVTAKELILFAESHISASEANEAS